LNKGWRCVEHETSFLVQINYCDWFAWCMVTAVALLLLLNDKCKPESLQRDGRPGWIFPQTAGCKASTCFVDRSYQLHQKPVAACSTTGGQVGLPFWHRSIKLFEATQPDLFHTKRNVFSISPQTCHISLNTFRWLKSGVQLISRIAN